MSKLDELIDWHEKHATYYTDSAVLQQTHRDTAEALRLCRDLARAEDAYDKWRKTGSCPRGDETGEAFFDRLDDERDALKKNIDTALAALRDAGMIDPPKPASGTEQGQRGGE